MTLSEPITVKRWTDSAVCASVGGIEFFPDPGQGGFTAKKLCASCPVKAECLSEALSEPWIMGIWGGFSERRRQELRSRLLRENGRLPTVDELRVILENMPTKTKRSVRRWSGRRENNV